MDDPHYYEYKCRKNWWTAVLAWIELVWDCEIKDLELILLMSQFDQFARKLDFNAFREEGDIKKANLFLDKILTKMRLIIAK